MDRRLKDLSKAILAKWGVAWDQLGPELQAAIRAQAVLQLCCAQDESIKPENLRALMEEGLDWANRGLS